MKVLLNLLLALGAAGAALNVIDEDFGGSQFPPAGWSTSGSGGGWQWRNVGGYAEGSVSVGPFAYSTTTLKSPTFHLNGPVSLHVRFRYRTYAFTEGVRSIRIGGWAQGVPYDRTWREFVADTTPVGPGNVSAEFTLSLSGGSHGMSTLWYLDDAIISYDDSRVEPASWGRVKAAYR